jgi:hypothetical protein
MHHPNISLRSTILIWNIFYYGRYLTEYKEESLQQYIYICTVMELFIGVCFVVVENTYSRFSIVHDQNYLLCGFTLEVLKSP